MNLRTILAAAGAALIGGTALVAWGHARNAEIIRPELEIPRSAEFDYDPPAPGSYRLPVVKPAAAGTVLDETGAARDLSGILDGRITVMAFVYMNCADICPKAMLLLHDLHGLTNADPSLREGLQLVTLSFDPVHDTPEMMAMHGAALRAGEEAVAPWHFLTTAGEAALRPLLDAYDQPLGPRPSTAGEITDFEHQLRVFLIDHERQIRNIYSMGFLDPRMVVTDVRTLMMEKTGGAGVAAH